MAAIASPLSVRRIHLGQHRRAVRDIFAAYPPGTDALADEIRAAAPLKRFLFRHIFAPLYFAREQGWVICGTHGEMAAILYLRRQARAGLHVLHVDEISVSAQYRRLGLAQRLLALTEDLARQEHRPFLKLAVTVANTPAVTLYRRLGYVEEHHHYFSLLSTPAGNVSASSAGITLRPLRRGEAEATLQQFYHMELAAGKDYAAEMLAVYYPMRVPKRTKRLFAIEQSGQEIGYGDAIRKGLRWRVNLCLRPDLWGTEVEQHAIRQVANTVPREEGEEIALSVACAAHHEKLAAMSTGCDDVLLSERSYDRMIMCKRLENV